LAARPMTRTRFLDQPKRTMAKSQKPPTPSSSARSAARNGITCPYEARARGRPVAVAQGNSACSAICDRRCAYPALADASSLKTRGRVEGLDIMIVARNSPAGVYSGEPKDHHRSRANGQKRAIDLPRVYDTYEIRGASPASPSDLGAQAPQQGDLDGEAHVMKIRACSGTRWSPRCTRGANTRMSRWSISSPIFRRA